MSLDIVSDVSRHHNGALGSIRTYDTRFRDAAKRAQENGKRAPKRGTTISKTCRECLKAIRFRPSRTHVERSARPAAHCPPTSAFARGGADSRDGAAVAQRLHQTEALGKRERPPGPFKPAPLPDHGNRADQAIGVRSLRRKRRTGRTGPTGTVKPWTMWRRFSRSKNWLMRSEARPRRPPTTSRSLGTGGASTARRRFSVSSPSLRLLGRTGSCQDHLSRSLTEFSPERLVEVLDRHGVEYLIVGGVAARAYGASRQTKEIDCLVRRTPANLDRLAAAKRELHARYVLRGCPMPRRRCSQCRSTPSL